LAPFAYKFLIRPHCHNRRSPPIISISLGKTNMLRPLRKISR
jgi:hypothetical protein